MKAIGHTILPAMALIGAMPIAALAQHDTATDTAPQPSDAILAERTEDIAMVLRGEKAAEVVFSESFLRAVSADQLLSMTRSLEGQLGSFVGVEGFVANDDGRTGTVTFRFRQATAAGPIRLAPDAPYLVDTLLLNDVQPISDTTTPVVDQIAALPGETSLLLASLDGEDVVFDHNADTPLALGSTFKLYVLSRLVQEIAAGERAWDDTVPLSVRSFPSGTLQDWPQGAPLTLHTLATLMISISDNTATDQLIALLGRDAMEEELVAAGNSALDRNSPLLTTRELFLLKAAPGSAIADYSALDRAGRLAAIEQVRDADVSLEDVIATFSGAPQHIDVEWFASARDMARLLDRIAADPVALDILAVDPGLPESATEGWTYVGYKGGSEPGVLNMTWLLRDAVSHPYVLSLGWNDPDQTLSTAELLNLARSALDAHRDGDRAR